MREKAKDFYRKNLRGTRVRNPILGEIDLTDDSIMFTNVGLNKMGATSAQFKKLLLVKHLPELIQNADSVSAEENYKDKRNASQYAYLHSTAIFAGMTVEQLAGTDITYAPPVSSTLVRVAESR